MLARIMKYVNDFFALATFSNIFFFFCFPRSRSGRLKLSEKQNQLSSKEVIIEDLSYTRNKHLLRKLRYTFQKMDIVVSGLNEAGKGRNMVGKCY